jgi:ankyrin repeat protein
MVALVFPVAADGIDETKHTLCSTSFEQEATSREHGHDNAMTRLSDTKGPVAYLRSFLPSDDAPPLSSPSSSKTIQDLPKSKISSRSISRYQPPTPERLDAYTMAAVTAIRNKDVGALRNMLRTGASLNACNRSGETLLHLACRRGNAETVAFLLHEAHVPWDLTCELGRTVLHDACWRPAPDFPLFDVLLRAVPPHLLLAPDARGHCCLEYARKADWNKWVVYLCRRRTFLVQRVGSTASALEE